MMELLFMILSMVIISFIALAFLLLVVLYIGRGFRKMLGLDVREKEIAPTLGRWKPLLSGGMIALFMILNDLTETNRQLAGLTAIFVLMIFLILSFFEWRKDRTSLEYKATFLTGLFVAVITFPFMQFVLGFADRYILT